MPDLITFQAAEISALLDGTITIKHASANDSLAAAEFLGYDVYYKLYRGDDNEKFQQDRDYITDDIRQPSPSVITSRSYLKLKLVEYDTAALRFEDITDTPNISMGSSNAKVVLNFAQSIQLGNADEFGYQAQLINQDGTKKIIHRNLNDATRSFFETNGLKYSSSDYDVNRMISSFTDIDSIDIAIAVVPYGLDLQTVSFVYGTISVTENLQRIKN